MTEYRLIKGIDWDALDNERVTLQVSPQYLIAAKRDGSILVLARAVQPRRKKGEHVPVPDAVPWDGSSAGVAAGS